MQRHGRRLGHDLTVVRWLHYNQRPMGLLAAILTMVMVAFVPTAQGGGYFPYITMPVGLGHATDAKGVRYANAACMQDAVYAPAPFIPLDPHRHTGSATKGPESLGLYRLDIDLKTGRVTKVTIVKSGTSTLNDLSVRTFRNWLFKPGKWKEIMIPTKLGSKWSAVIWRSGG